MAVSMRDLLALSFQQICRLKSTGPNTKGDQNRRIRKLTTNEIGGSVMKNSHKEAKDAIVFASAVGA